MDKKKLEVIFKKKAINNINHTTAYIIGKGYPMNAVKYADRLYDFGQSLAIFPDKPPVCRFPKFSKKGFHCAVFDGTYIFVYKVDKNKLIIFNIIHSKRLF